MTVQIIVILQNTLITHPLSRPALQSFPVEGVLPAMGPLAGRYRINYTSCVYL